MSFRYEVMNFKPTLTPDQVRVLVVASDIALRTIDDELLRETKTQLEELLVSMRPR